MTTCNFYKIEGEKLYQIITFYKSIKGVRRKTVEKSSFNIKQSIFLLRPFFGVLAQKRWYPKSKQLPDILAPKQPLSSFGRNYHYTGCISLLFPKKLSYSPFHKTLPKSSLQMKRISVRFYEMGNITEE